VIQVDNTICNGIYADVQRAFPDLKLDTTGSRFYADVIAVCKDIYMGSPPWKSVKRAGLSSKGQRDMETLNTAKVLCDEFSNMSFSEKTEIIISDERIQEYINGVLDANRFYSKMPAFLSLMYALGGGVIKCYAVDGTPVIDYLPADCFVPTAYSNRGITAGAFRSVSFIKNRYYSLFEYYNGGRVEYKLFRSPVQGQLGEECPLSELYERLPSSVDYGTDVPMFAYFFPAVSNNLAIGSPFGLSVFANSESTLKALDIAFDSFSREFILGRKRIIVPSSCVRTVVDADTGQPVRYFDSDDEVYQALSVGQDQEMPKISDNTVSLRIEEHVGAINAYLNTLCAQTGLTSGTLAFDREGLKTATEIVSENSKTYRTIRADKNLIEESLVQVVHALTALGEYLGLIPQGIEYECSVAFNDGIIEDHDKVIDNNIKLVDAGLQSRLGAIMEIYECDEETAQKRLKRINKENAASVYDFKEDIANGTESS
jgi:A118 family predicted phage portal protein